MRILSDPRLGVEPLDDDPTELDRAYAAESSPFAGLDAQAAEPTPDEALADATDYDAWPEWAQTERWGLVDEPEAFGQPVGVARLPMTDLDLPRRGATRIGPEEEARMWGRGRPGDDALIDRLGRCDGYPPVS